MDEFLFIFMTIGMVVLPSVLVIPWALMTNSPIIKQRLLVAFYLLASVPFLHALTFVALRGYCEEGNLDQAFGGCGIIPDRAAQFSYFIWIVPAVAFGLVQLLRSFLDERRARRA